MSQTNKPKVAFFDFTCCEGCQLTVVDSLQTHPELLNAVEIVQFREAMTEKGEDYAVAFIEGSCSRESDEARLKQIREQAAVVVALGTCAHLGGVNSLKYLHPLEDVRHYVYGDKADWYETYDVRPIDAVIKVDFAIPFNAGYIARVIGGMPHGSTAAVARDLAHQLGIGDIELVGLLHRHGSLLDRRRHPLHGSHLQANLTCCLIRPTGSQQNAKNQ